MEEVLGSLEGSLLINSKKFNKSQTMTPEPAIDGFLASYSTMYKILHKGDQVHIMKTADYPVY